ncbi:MAG: hypothetical protein NTW86_14140, partial [Candidatus Sumerlaeota bacterium]|nr:hypothetical protein [Candidatus Sumerlaeota bacterium]
TFNKQAVAMDRQQQAIDLARKHGIRYASTFILGAPGETRDDIISSFEFVSANLDVFHYVQFHPLVVLPGTEVWEWAKRVGVTDANLEGVAFEPADVADERDYYLKRWPFLNEANMSREELYSYFLAAQKIEALVWGHTQTRETLEQARRELDQARGEARTARSPEYVAANTPILSIVREKARRRLRQILDHGASK